MTHCESCGRENPPTHDGYTVCCNELKCHGYRPADRLNLAWDGHLWGNDTDEPIKACCGHKADEAFIARDGSAPASYWRVD